MSSLKRLVSPHCPSISWRRFSKSLNSPHLKTNDKVGTRQSEIMARGLPKKKPIAGVKHTVLVASGKGGVGKSTTAVNLAVAIKMQQPSKEVGLLDADVFGPSIPLMMNLHESPLLDKNNFMVPLQNYGVKCMSMGFLIEEKNPVIWRGLMVMQALDRLIRQVSWNPLDYMVIDTPPGTGDTHLSLIQNIPISGVVLVTTPQRAALDVTRRGGNMFKKLEIPIIGIVENMSKLQCPHCLQPVSLYGNSTSDLAEELSVPVLEDIPLHQDINRFNDEGAPIVISAQSTPQAGAYKNLAEKVVRYLTEIDKNGTNTVS